MEVFAMLYVDDNVAVACHAVVGCNSYTVGHALY
jgi:hypothetical protein